MLCHSVPRMLPLEIKRGERGGNVVSTKTKNGELQSVLLQARSTGARVRPSTPPPGSSPLTDEQMLARVVMDVERDLKKKGVLLLTISNHC